MKTSFVTGIIMATLLATAMNATAAGAPSGAQRFNKQHVQQKTDKKMKYYCEYCGLSFPSINSLTASRCTRHPLGSCKGSHKPYEGGEKSRYTCRYCGQQFQSLHSLVTCKCPRHPNGSCKGDHAPML